MDDAREGDEYRAEFDAAVTFANGGSLEARGFRLDLPHAEIDDRELGEMFVRHLGLLMVAGVTISNRRTVRERHKGSRSVTTGQASGHRRRLIDLSHDIRDGLITYPGLPAPHIDEFLTRAASRARYAPGTEFSIGRIEMVGNTGTYLDTPFHRFAEGADLADLDLDRVVDLPGVVVRVTGSVGRAIDRPQLVAHDVSGRAVLVHTGWDRHWATERYAIAAPFLTRAAAEWLVAEGATVVGIDSINIDDTEDGSRPAHTQLLAAGIPIIEHLTGLDALPPTGFRFTAVPPRVAGMGTWPVRAFAVID